MRVTCQRILQASLTAFLLWMRTPSLSATDVARSIAPATTTTSFIMGESALVDKETGRIFWEAGVSNTLAATVGSKMRNLLQLHHLRATLLSSILWIALLRALAERSTSVMMTTATRYYALVRKILPWTILLLPKFDAWFVWTVAIFYLVESYFSSTRQYLTHCVASSEELEAYLEQLREAAPQVEWKVRSFHYEVLSPALAAMVRTWQNMTSSSSEEEEAFVVDAADTTTTAGTQRELPAWMKRKKVTNYAVGSYQYQDCIDKTLAGVWKRAKGYYDGTSLAAPMSKITLSKLFVFSDSKTRQDYFEQQAAFVSEHCERDRMAEFATNIVVPGFKPRLLAIRHAPHESRRARMALRFVSLPWFWCFTLLGLTAPYRFWFDDQCDELRVSVVKETSAEPRKSVSSNNSNNKSAWFWSRYVPLNKNNDDDDDESDSMKEMDESNQFRMLMKELQLYGSPSPVASTSMSIKQQDEEALLRKDDKLQDVIESVESASLMAEQEETTLESCEDDPPENPES